MSRPRPKRFYKEVSTAAKDGAFIIQLDGMTLKTPGKLTFMVACPDLAEQVAQEWRDQDSHICPETMPLTRLVNVALELTPKNRPKLIDEARSYAATDLLCYREPASALARHQAENWDPVLEWARQKGMGLIPTDSLIAAEQPVTALDNVARYAENLDDLHLTLLLHLTAVFGSVILAIAVMEKHLTGEDAFALSRLDAKWQNKFWGEDEEDKDRTENIAQEIVSLCQIIR